MGANVSVGATGRVSVKDTPQTKVAAVQRFLQF